MPRIHSVFIDFKLVSSKKELWTIRWSYGGTKTCESPEGHEINLNQQPTWRQRDELYTELPSQVNALFIPVFFPLAQIDMFYY